jgi:hypothetical protein
MVRKWFKEGHMKRLILLLTLFSLTAPLISDELDDFRDDTESLYRTGAGSEDSTFTAISTSMLGWGIGLALGIGILASVLHQSTASSSHTTTSN